MSPVAIRALKRFVTDTIDPMSFKPERMSPNGNGEKPIAIIGSGPSGLTAAHYLSLKGYKVTVFESEGIPGGMLTCGIPSYRLPRAILDKEIESLVDENATLTKPCRGGADFGLDNRATRNTNWAGHGSEYSHRWTGPDRRCHQSSQCHYRRHSGRGKHLDGCFFTE